MIFLSFQLSTSLVGSSYLSFTKFSGGLPAGLFLLLIHWAWRQSCSRHSILWPRIFGSRLMAKDCDAKTCWNCFHYLSFLTCFALCHFLAKIGFGQDCCCSFSFKFLFFSILSALDHPFFILGLLLLLLLIFFHQYFTIWCDILLIKFACLNLVLQKAV